MRFPNIQAFKLFTLSVGLSHISLDYVKLEWSDTNLSQEQAEILPSLKNLAPGTIIDNEPLLELLNATPPGEFFDVNESTYNYVQRIPFEKYNSDSQLFTSERELILGSLLSHIPETRHMERFTRSETKR